MDENNNGQLQSKPRRELKISNAKAKLPQDVLLELETGDEVLEFRMDLKAVKNIQAQLKKALGEK
jgi:hypothetical protein